MAYEIIEGDSLKVLPTFDAESFDAVVTDPPYGIAFMGKEWDDHSPQAYAAFSQAWAMEALRVLKPGGYLLAFGGTRTSHRLATGVEDAGFEMRDAIPWLYGSGFPKSLDVSKAIDKAAGAEREVTGRTRTPFKVDAAASRGTSLRGSVNGDFSRQTDSDGYRYTENTAPATKDAQRWQGWGTALKPAYEPIIVARKPLIGTVAANVLEHGTGALNVDGCRVAGSAQGGVWGARQASPIGYCGNRPTGYRTQAHDVGDGQVGRWPSNVVLSHVRAWNGMDACGEECVPGCPVAELDEQSGIAKPKVARTGRKGGKRDNGTLRGAGSGSANPAEFIGTWPDDGGGASRFFPTFRYQAKAPTKERPKVDGVAHPTVKPLALMRWLCRLVTPPGGHILDPFAGSGATVEAAILEGFNVTGIEREPTYLPLIEQRIERVANGR